VLGDATQLHQVFMNLCVNARDAMQEGGVLTLKAENVIFDDRNTALHIDAHAGPYVIISVIDTGMGIPQEHLDKIFDPFFTTKELGKGTGLGLSTVLGIVKGHDGFVTVYSELHRGTTFKIYIPAAESTAVKKAEKTKAEVPLGHGETILVVDDEASVREVTRHILENANYQVITARDGLEALSLFARNRDTIKVVLTDMMMPNLDGAAVIKELQRIDPGVKVIAASGLLNNENTPEIRSPNVQAFLTKPYKAERLFWVLDAVLR
jgi:CheY-like chemotaxis protein